MRRDNIDDGGNGDRTSSLTPEQYDVLIGKGTERPFTGTLLHNKAKGIYICGACGNPLFSSNDKFDSGSGWPSFSDVKGTGSVVTDTDISHGMVRTEVRCAKCGGHLGHLFNDGPAPTGLRYCINSVAMIFRTGSE
jgi:peptide-methionine (R)-S-oxide reductase